MKLMHLLIGLFYAGTIVAGCSSGSNIATEIDGTWTAVPENIISDDSLTVEALKYFEFDPISSERGTVIIGGMISMEHPFDISNDNSSDTHGMAIGAAIASISGTFEATGSGAIVLHLDPATFAFKINPQGVNYEFDNIDNNIIQEDTIVKRRLTDYFYDNVSRHIKDNFMAVSEIRDIEINGETAKVNINNIGLTLRRQ